MTETPKEIIETKTKVPDVQSPIVTTQIKVKDPKKVEQGKKLAEISRKAKEEKKKRLEELKGNPGSNTFYIVGIIGILGLGIFCYMKYPQKRPLEKKQMLSPVIEEPEPEPETKSETKLDTFD